MQTKPFYQSRTYWGLFVTLFSIVTQIVEESGANWSFPTWLVDFVNLQLVDFGTQIGMFIGIVVAAWGRNKASVKITMK